MQFQRIPLLGGLKEMLEQQKDMIGKSGDQGGIHRCAHFHAIYICLGVGDGNEDVISLKFE